MIDLQKLAELCAKATPGEWRVTGKKTIRVGSGYIGDMHWRNGEANAAYIASLDPQTVQALLAVVKAAQACRAAWIAEAKIHANVMQAADVDFKPWDSLTAYELELVKALSAFQEPTP